MDCDTCKANGACMAYVQPGSLLCTINRMNCCGTHAEEAEARSKQADRPAGEALYCQYCGRPLRIIGNQRFCNNTKCLNRFVEIEKNPRGGETVRVISEIVILFSVFEGTVFAFGGKNVSDRANGAKVASASLIALAILAATTP